MPSPKAVHVNPLSDYMLEVKFENGERRLFDVKPYLTGNWFSQLKDPHQFKTVHIAGLSLEWAGGQDICPDCLYEQSTPIAPGGN